MKTKLLTTVAALALIAGVSAASAQGQQPHEGKNPATQSAQPNSANEPESRSHNANPNQQSKDGDRGSPNTAADDKKDGAGASGTAANEMKKPQQGAQENMQRKDQKTQAQQTDARKSGADSSAKVELNSEQRTKISQTIKTQNVKRVTNVNFNLSIGTVVPRSYSFYPVPAPVVAVVPAYRGYLYLVVGDQMLIIHPRTHEIVAVIAV